MSGNIGLSGNALDIVDIHGDRYYIAMSDIRRIESSKLTVVNGEVSKLCKTIVVTFDGKKFMLEDSIESVVGPFDK